MMDVMGVVLVKMRFKAFAILYIESINSCVNTAAKEPRVAANKAFEAKRFHVVFAKASNRRVDRLLPIYGSRISTRTVPS